MDDLSRFCCLDSRCPDFGRRDAGNLTVTGRKGKNRQYRLLYCRSCRVRFSERKGTPLYRAHLPEETVASILEHATEGCGVRQTARLVKVHPDTVSRYTRVAGVQAHAAHGDLVARSPETREVQMDEAWSYVGKKEKNCDEDDPEDRFRGDCWDHVAFDPEHRLVLSVVPGERTAESVRELVGDVDLPERTVHASRCTSSRDFLGDAGAGTRHALERVDGVVEIVVAVQELRRGRVDVLQSDRAIGEVVLIEIVLPTAPRGDEHQQGEGNPAEDQPSVESTHTDIPCESRTSPPLIRLNRARATQCQALVSNRLRTFTNVIHVTCSPRRMTAAVYF